MNNRSKFLTLRTLNRGLSAAIIFICAYIVVTPFWPNITFWTAAVNSEPALVKAGKATTSLQYPNVNTLVIPSLHMQEQVYEGQTEAALRNGVWHRPKTSTPEKGSNTVLAGHRFTYSDPAVFYHLDKVKLHDEIILYWNKQKYIYQVTQIKEVSPTAIETENPTVRDTLTLYTCAPLWTSKNRMVVIANLTGYAK